MTTCSDEEGANVSSEGTSSSSKVPVVVPIAGTTERQEERSTADAVSLYIYIDCIDNCMSITVNNN